MSPALICVVFLFSFLLARPIAKSVHDQQFREGQTDYEKAVNQIRTLPNVTKAKLEEVDLNAIASPAGVVAIRATRCEKEAIVVEFLVSARGRAHRGYLFRGCEDPAVYGPGGIEGRCRLRHLGGQWYHFSD